MSMNTSCRSGVVPSQNYNLEACAEKLTSVIKLRSSNTPHSRFAVNKSPSSYGQVSELARKQRKERWREKTSHFSLCKFALFSDYFIYSIYSICTPPISSIRPLAAEEGNLAPEFCLSCIRPFLGVVFTVLFLHKTAKKKTKQPTENTFCAGSMETQANSLFIATITTKRRSG